MPSEKVLLSKKKKVAELTEKLKSSCAGVLVDYKGINANADTVLRRELREVNVEYKVVKNTLLRLSLKDANISNLSALLEGSTAIAISENDHIAASKVLCKFAKDNEFFTIKAGFIDGKMIDACVVHELANMPSKDVLISKLLGSLNSPITGLAMVLNGTLKNLVCVIDAIAKKDNA